MSETAQRREARIEEKYKPFRSKGASTSHQLWPTMGLQPTKNNRDEHNQQQNTGKNAKFVSDDQMNSETRPGRDIVYEQKAFHLNTIRQKNQSEEPNSHPRNISGKQ